MIGPPPSTPPLTEAVISQVLDYLKSAPPASGLDSALAAARWVTDLTKRNRGSTDFLDAMQDMSLPQAITVRLSPFFNAVGLKLETADLPDPYDLTTVRRYTAVRNSSIDMAILHLPQWFLQTTNSIGSLKQAIETISGYHGRVISDGLHATAGGYRRAFKSMSTREANTWNFVAWNEIEEIFERRNSVQTVFDLPSTIQLNGKVDPAADIQIKLSDKDEETIVQIFARAAANNSTWFDGVVAESSYLSLELRGQLQETVRTGDNKTKAQKLLNQLKNWKRFGISDPHPEDTYLGRMLLRRLPFLGGEDREAIARIVLKYQLVTGEDDLQKARTWCHQES
ncbi:MAG: hypothetical protein JO001_29185 [Alphaproteobacteria bacterium]|nr:hypothetical protein [Alphaproteobacteria bacterium]